MLAPVDKMNMENSTPIAKKAPKHSLLFNIAARVVITLLAAGVFCLLRPDSLDGMVLAYRHYIASPRIISEYLKQNQIRKLQIGAGPSTFPTWLDTDFEPRAGQAFLDATAPFPLPDNSFDYVFSEHVIEHLNYVEGLSMLRESHRILRPGGRVRVVTPDLSQLVSLFAQDKSEDTQKYMRDKIAFFYWPKTPDDAGLILNLELHEWRHQFVYSPALLRDGLEKVGFHNVRQYHVGESDDPALVKIEARIKTSQASLNQYESLVMEAER
jgi:predicted SAM-dependent methyltransferase